ncbi:MAG: RDD family protein [Chloroflexota bacterium]|nr:RDD family protein [Chloroflexota bacterium]
MKRFSNRLSWIAIPLVLVSAAWAQVPDDPGSLPQVQKSRTNSQFRFGSSLELRAGDRADDVVVIVGSAEIDGTVEGDLFVLVGSLVLGSTAVIEGDAVVIGGSASVSPGAVAEGDFAVLAGALDAPEGFPSGGGLGVVGGGVGTEFFAPVMTWLSSGLLLGRPLVPELLWAWIFVAVFALLYLGTNWVFERPVRDVAAALGSKPLTCFLVGGLVVLLIGPVSLLLVASVVGLPAVPLLWLALLLAVILGKVGVTRWIGGRVVPEQFPGDRVQAARSVAIGLAILSLAYMVPVLGMTAWTVLGVLALGAATTTAAQALRRENPRATVPARAAVVAVAQSGAGERSEVATPEAEGDDRPEGEAVQGEEPTPEPGTAVDLPLASFPARIGAVALDFIPFVIIGQALNVGVLLTLLMFSVYNTAMWAWRGTTVGGMICRVRLVRTDGRALAPQDGVVRGVASVVSIAFLGLGWIWAAWDEKRQSWHDRAAGTYVVRDESDF